MKSIFFAPLITALAALNAHAGALVEREIKGFDLRVCTTDGTRCVNAKSPKAVGSHFKSIYYMADMEAKIEGKDKLASKAWTGARGYYDMDMNQLVIEPAKGGRWAETVIDLENIEATEMKK